MQLSSSLCTYNICACIIWSVTWLEGCLGGSGERTQGTAQYAHANPPTHRAKEWIQESANASIEESIRESVKSVRLKRKAKSVRLKRKAKSIQLKRKGKSVRLKRKEHTQFPNSDSELKGSTRGQKIGTRIPPQIPFPLLLGFFAGIMAYRSLLGFSDSNSSWHLKSIGTGEIDFYDFFNFMHFFQSECVWNLSKTIFKQV